MVVWYGGMYGVLSERCIAASGRTAGDVGEERALLRVDGCEQE